MARSRAAYIAAQARRRRLDPRAVLAVARGEGGLTPRPGFQDVGDLSGGGSYGPFQLYTQGALPRNIARRPQSARDAWAWSNQGINYALNRIAGVASGQRGAQAINSIIRRFERPADPDASVRKALARYKAGGGIPSVNMGGGRLSAATGGIPKRDALLQFVFANNQSFIQTGRVDPNASLNMMRAIQQMEDYGLDGGHANPDGGIKVSSKDWKGGRAAILQAMSKARQMGLRVGENPRYDRVDPVHTKGSYHYQRFGGNVGRAADISGSAKQMAAFYRWANRRYGGKLTELFYDPLGGIKHGRQIGAIGGHGSHVHIAF